MSSTRLFRFKERERNSREEAFFSVLLDDEKTKLATQHLYLPSSMCAVTRSQHLHFQLERRGKKNKPHQKSVTIRGTWQAAGAEQEAQEEVKHHSLGRGWSLEKSRDSIFTTSPILEAWSKHRIGIIWSLGDCVSQLFLAEFLYFWCIFTLSFSPPLLHSPKI